MPLYHYQMTLVSEENNSEVVWYVIGDFITYIDVIEPLRALPLRLSMRTQAKYWDIDLKICEPVNNCALILPP